jgi:integrase/DNA-binding phage protein
MFRIAKRTRRDDAKLLAECRKIIRREKHTANAIADGAGVNAEQAVALLTPEGEPKVAAITAAAAWLGVNVKKFVGESEKFYVCFRDHLGLEQRIPATTDKRTSTDFGRNVERLVNARKGGSEVPADVLRWAETLDPIDAGRLVSIGLIETSALAASQPINEHIAAWVEHMRSNGRGEKHIGQCERCLRKLFEVANVRQWGGITLARVEAALDKVPMKGGGPVTPQVRNGYTGIAKAFCRFMVKKKRAQTNPLTDLADVPCRPRGRRALSRDEVECLIRTTATGPVLTFRDWGSDFSVTGAERALIYSLVRWTGLRAKEARGMLVKDFLLDAPVPHVFVSAELAKNKRENRVPLPAHLVPELKAYLAQKMPDAKALPVPERAAYMLRLDMQAGRTAFIAAGTTPEERERRARSTFLEVEIETEKFLPFDFHSLRGTASVLLQEQGIPVGFVQKILNHRTPIMTLNNYTNPQLETLARAMAGETPSPVRIAAS